MRILNAALGAALLVMVASPALAGDPRGGGGGGHHGGGGGCGGRCGGGHPPGGGNINVNVNANASAFAGASASAFLNARTYDIGGIRGGMGGGGVIYTGGGHGGDFGGHYGGGAVYYETAWEGRACASAPFGYVVGGFGREGRRPPACLGGGGDCHGEDRGGRYGHSERRGCDGGRREDYYDGYAESGGSYESYESYEEYESYTGGYVEERGYGGHDRGHDCDCRHDDRDYAPYPPPYLPEPSRYEPPAPPARPYRPHRPRPSHPPRQHYSQEPGERG